MPKEIAEVPLVSISLDRSSSVPLYKQLYDVCRGLILSGRFGSGLKLPGTRTLAKELGVSRNTVLLAFEQLMVEGYVVAKIGGGTYVSRDIPNNLVRAGRRAELSVKGLSSTDSEEKSTHVSGTRRWLPENNIIPFQHGTPSLQDFPFDKWVKLSHEIMHRSPMDLLGRTDAAGYMDLREEIARYLQVYRAVNCTPAQIFIVNGSQQGLYLISRVLMKEGDDVLLEDPFYFGVRGVARSAKANIVPVPVDEEGMRIDYAAKYALKAKLIYTTPSHQYPLGSTMSTRRRLRLIEFAAEKDLWIVEDDYDGEFRYSGPPLPSLQGMDRNGRVIYVGTFSKVLFPGLRLGYLVLPSPDLVDSFAAARAVIDRQSPVLDQLVTAEFMARGYFTTHIRKMRILYRERQELLVNEVRKRLGKLVKIGPAVSGMHILAWLPEHMDDKEVSEALGKRNVIAYALSDGILKYRRKPALILGYTAFDKKQIETGVEILSDTIRQFRR